MKTPGRVGVAETAILAVFALASCADAAAPRGSAPRADREPAAEPYVAAPTPADVVGPSPLVSRRKPIFGRSAVPFARAAYVNDGDARTVWTAGRPTADRPAWVAVDLGLGPGRVLVTWSAAGSFDYEETDYGSPGAYRLETSASSTDGEDGAWESALVVPDVTTHGGAHVIAFAGKRWLRFVVTGTPAVSPNGVQLDELEVRDVSTGLCDAWFFMGDSITALAFGRRAPGVMGFSERVRLLHGPRQPAVLNGGVGGTSSADGARSIDGWLARSPDVHFWAIGYGTNDAAGNGTGTGPFRANLETLVRRVRAAHREPIFATIPFASDGQHAGIPLFNAVIGDLQRSYGLHPGPDLYAWFEAHPEELRDGVHPNEVGVASINRLWAESAAALYRR